MSLLQSSAPSAADPPTGPTRIVVLGTGGTIAGAAASADDNVGYQAGVVGVAELLGAARPDAKAPGNEGGTGGAAPVLEAEQVAQLNSKDMDTATWTRLLRRAQAHLARPEVRGLVITHGTDTLEETAYLLHRVLQPRKPVVLTAAMRPATGRLSDGPQNLQDALRVAAEPGAGGVMLALGSRVWAGAEVRKVHTYDLQAFSAGDAGPVALVREGRVAALRTWPVGDPAQAVDVQRLPGAEQPWPSVPILTSHAGFEPRWLQAWLSAGIDGLVLSGTGNGTLHEALEAALPPGLPVLVATRCAGGGVVGEAPHGWPTAGSLTPAQARIELMLRLLAP